MAIHSRYSDQRFRRSVASFWSTVWPDKTFEKQIRESRKIEDLVIHFVTSATKSLKKDDTLHAGAWMSELHVQISTFLDVLAEVIRTSSPSSGELLVRIQGYRQRIDDDTAARTATVVTDDPPHRAVNDADDHLRIVKQLFDVSEFEFRARIQALSNKCTPSVSLLDLIRCLSPSRGGIGRSQSERAPFVLKTR